MTRPAALLALMVFLAAAGPAGWGDLSHWIGRYPSDSDAKPPARLLDVPAIRATLEQVLGPADRTRLRSLAVESPIERSGSFLVAKQCMPHDCGDHNAMVVLDMSARRMWVGLFSRTAPVTATQWFGTSDFHDLPVDILKAFDAQHGLP